MKIEFFGALGFFQKLLFYEINVLLVQIQRIKENQKKKNTLEVMAEEPF
jgi:hypothetical protein